MAAPGTPAAAATRRRARRVLIAASLGTLIEWYDFALFIVAAGLVINPVFFPEQTGIIGLLAVTATIAVGYFIRPIGGLVLSNLGDRWGRKPTLVLTISLMSVGTFAIGVLPTPQQIGIWAPILLVFFRALQGFGAGAELTGALTIVSEFYPGRRLGLATGIAFGMSGAGGVFATLALTLVAGLPDGAFLEWAWRLPFLFSAVLFFAAIWLRSTLEESPEFAAVARAKRDSALSRRLPLVSALKLQPGMVVRGFFIWCGHNAFGYLALTFSINYLVTVENIPGLQTLTLSMAAFTSLFVWSIFWAWMSDKIGHRRLLVIFGLAVLLAITPFMLLVQSGTYTLAVLAIVGLGGCIAGISQGVIGAVTTSMFPTEYRFSALTAGKELNAALIGGPTPLIATALLIAADGQPWLVIGFVALMAVLTLVSISPATGTSGSPADVAGDRSLDPSG